VGGGRSEMIAVDTNIVVRYAVKDDPVQTRSATSFLRENQCLLLPTVVLESVWVMGSKRGYALEPAMVAERIRQIAGLPTVSVYKALQVSLALDWYEAGMDFADALHLAIAGKEMGLATLDKGIRSSADRLGIEYRVVLVPPYAGDAP
jgi:predicted nucleic-acid-binding protein